MHTAPSPADLVAERCGTRSRFTRIGAIIAITNNITLPPAVAAAIGVEDSPFAATGIGVAAMLRTEADLDSHDPDLGHRSVDAFLASFTGQVIHTNPDPWLIPSNHPGAVEDLIEFHVWLHAELTAGAIPEPISTTSAAHAA